MKTVAQFTTTFSLFWFLLVLSPTATLAQPAKPALPKTPPNTVLKVKRQLGNCPKTVGLWTSFRYYEGGGEHTVIADTSAIAKGAQIISSGNKLVDYKASLKTAYADCIGTAIDESDGERLYQFIFREGKVFFRVVLPPDTDANPSEFSAVSILGSRPYVRWAIAD